jgi:integrase/predicted RNA-binding Zn-ribbon protein involved in translation (DUF1610 family)
MGTAEESGDEENRPLIEDAGFSNWANPQPPKSRPESPEKGLKCPECGSERLYRDGLRRLADGSQTQRWLCRECGFRFSERRLNSGGKDLKSGSALNLNCRVCAQEIEAKNSVSRELRLMENGQTAEKRAAGATETPSEPSNTPHMMARIFEYAWTLKKQGYAEQTIESRVKILKRLVKIGADLFNPESVKDAIAKQKWSDGRKELIVDAYGGFLKFLGGKWDPPRYQRVRKIPFIPTETEIDQLISGCGRKTATLLQLLKETGMRVGEAWKLKWADIDFIKGTVSIIPEKGSEPRILKVSNNLMQMLRALYMRAKSDKVFPASPKSQARLFYDQRRKIAEKLKNPRILKISFHTLRYWKATMEYYKTKDILHVMRLLGHKNIKNTLIYTQLAKFEDEDEFICKVARTPDEISKLIEAGFEYVCEHEGLKFFRKRK